MPTYGYHCDSCDTEFELWQKMTDDAVADCPVCGKAGRRLFYPAGIVFRGSGFYKTDSRSSSSASTPAPSGSSSSTKSGTEGGTEKKASGDSVSDSSPSTPTTKPEKPSPTPTDS